MMISDKMAARLNEQVKNEYFAFWTYKAMAFALEDMGLKVFAKWFHLQSEEEKGHAEKIADYIVDQGGQVKLTELPSPKTDYKSCQEIIEGALEHELMVTKQINDIVDMANGEKDHATRKFIDWFVEEQVEEVASVTEILDLVKYTKDTGQLLMLESRIYRLVEARS
jgi:ferritin